MTSNSVLKLRATVAVPSSLKAPNHRLPPIRPRVSLIADAPAPYGQPLTSAEDVWALLKEHAACWDRERFITLALDAKHRVLGVDEVSIGTLTQSFVHPREVFKALILANAKAFVCAHNHPSSDPEPSAEDVAVTERLREAGQLLGIPLLDHVIIGGDAYYSFQSSGRL